MNSTSRVVSTADSSGGAPVPTVVPGSTATPLPTFAHGTSIGVGAGAG
jgi:hypothetical protein